MVNLMVAYNFQPRFERPILSGTKKQTIRQLRSPPSRHARPGEELQLYVAQRSKHARLLCRPHCLRLCRVTLDLNVGVHLPAELETISDDAALDAFAVADGFDDWRDLQGFWRVNHPGVHVFSGVLVEWTDRTGPAQRADGRMTTDVEAIDLPFTQAIRFFQKKARVPTQRWNDVWRSEHSHNFMVAGAATDALLTDFQTAIAKALTKGTTLAEFRKDFDGIVEKHGWAYNGSPGWRSRIIYETNLSTAYSAGRYMQLTEPETLEAFPYWQYVHSGSRHPRLQHLAWNGLVLRADDPFWQTHFPPNGWRCGCRVRPLSRMDLGRLGKNGPDKAPPIEYRPWTDKVTGTVHQVPVGIDPGFDYNPGLAARSGLANVPVKSDPMRPGKLASTPRAPEAGAPLPKLPEALRAFLEAPEGNVALGKLPSAVQKALGSDVAEVLLSPATLAKQRSEHKDLTDEHYALLPDLVRDPTVALEGRNERLLLLRRSGGVWLAVLKTTATGHENYVVSFRRVSAKDLPKMLETYDQVYGDADELGDD